jgi:hypothetical protein
MSNDLGDSHATEERGQLLDSINSANLKIFDLETSRNQFIDRNRRLRDVLESIEWVDGSCPSCKASKPEHGSECAIASVLGPQRTDASECICADCLNHVAHTGTPHCLPNRWNVGCVQHVCRARLGHRCKQEIFKDEPQYQEQPKA